jgi:tetratricopeptide (TPR) repeat protein
VIERLIQTQRWKEARAEIRARLRQEPANHWLLTRLSLTYYEERRYAEALRYADAAGRIQPTCPLVLWDLAGALQMLQRHDEAIRVYRRLVRRGVEDIAEGPCGEGRAWARGLVADCHYRLSECYRAQGKRQAADRAFVRHLDMRGPGCRSIYPLSELEFSYRNVRPSKVARGGPTRS